MKKELLVIVNQNVTVNKKSRVYLPLVRRGKKYVQEGFYALSLIIYKYYGIFFLVIYNLLS